MCNTSELKPTERFSNRAEDYRRHRPGYPAAVAGLMRDECGLRVGAAIADIGAGTGIFSRVLLDAGFDVTAVEPNDAMRAVAEEELRGFPRFHSVAAPAEKTGLAEGVFDAITVAQAFHWFDRAAARREFARLLRPGGWVFIVWNRRRGDASAFARDYEELNQSLGKPYREIEHRDPAARARAHEELFAGGTMRRAQFDNPHVLDWAGLRGRFLSTSYAPAKGDPRHEDYLARLEAIFQRHAVDGRVTFDQATEVYYGKLDAQV